MSDTDSNDALSDVSLDEEDEELIWRVFYNTRERNLRAENREFEMDDQVEVESISDLSDLEDPELVNEYRNLKDGTIGQNLTQEEKNKLIVSAFSDDHMDRFVAYRRVGINKPGIKKLCNGFLGQSVSQNMAIALSGISKVFLGEIISRAFEIQEREYRAQLRDEIEDKKRKKLERITKLDNKESDETESADLPRLEYNGDTTRPLQPCHIREAWRLYKLENEGAFSGQRRRQGEADGRLFR
ncbi:Transcription initiation factor TFIID subunit 11 [Meyerozyma sp. JA9]|nr:Transcription initiation factor TFIID subunit 11 [Meyerozyma sp. JA9]